MSFIIENVGSIGCSEDFPYRQVLSMNARCTTTLSQKTTDKLGECHVSETVWINSVIPRTDVLKQTARIGAEIRGVKLANDLPDQIITAINSLLLEHKVIFFRNQGHIDDTEQELFAGRFGKLAPELVPATGTMSILDLDSARRLYRTDLWHIDLSCLDAYPKYSVLRSVVIPPVGGDTVWSNTAAAYSDLPPALQRLADDLWVVHSFDPAARAPEADKNHAEEALTTARFETEHPVVRVHPETGERTLLLGSYAKGFVDVSKYDGQRLFDIFESHIAAPENTVRWKWEQGDVAMWDNRATMHYAVHDYGEQRRVVRRATIVGEVPVSVDGRRSVARVG